jgi:hypothetical protein
MLIAGFTMGTSSNATRAVGELKPPSAPTGEKE